ERAARTEAIQSTLRNAAEVPLGVMRLTAVALEAAKSVAEHGHRAADSDVGVGVTLLAAGIRGARLNVEINLEVLADRSYAGQARAEAERLANEAPGAAEAAMRLLRNQQ